MPRSGTFLEALTSYYSTLAFGTLAAMRSAQEDLRTGNFQLTKTVGDAISLYLDASEGWWSALLVTASVPLPTVFMRITANEDTTAAQDVAVLVPGTKQPECTDLGRIGGTDTIDASYVAVQASRDRCTITVKLKGLRKQGKPLAAGLYQALVHIDEKPLAAVFVRVDPARKV